jgi:hypothetical protein
MIRVNVSMTATKEVGGERITKKDAKVALEAMTTTVAEVMMVMVAADRAGVMARNHLVTITVAAMMATAAALVEVGMAKKDTTDAARMKAVVTTQAEADMAAMAAMGDLRAVGMEEMALPIMTRMK